MEGPSRIRPLAAIGAAILCAFILKTVAFDVMRVEGESMTPLIQPGSRVFVNKLAYSFRLPLGQGCVIRWAHPAPGDLIVFANPRDGKTVVKRCIALGPERLALEEGRIRIGTAVLDIDEANSLKFRAIGELPSEMVFAAGDNSENSVDSRDYGFIAVDNIFGKASYPRNWKER